MRCYCLVEPRFDNKVAISFPDIDVDVSWPIDSLPFDRFDAGHATPADQSPNQQLVDELTSFVPAGSHNAVHGIQAFLYLYLRLSQQTAR